MEEDENILAAVGLEHVLDELVLGRTSVAAADFGAVGVDRDRDPIVAEVEDVVALAAVTGERAEVVVVSARSGCLVLVVTRYRLGERLELAPGRIVTLLELGEGTVFVLEVTERQYVGGCEALGEFGGVLVTAGCCGAVVVVPARGARIAGDIPDGDDRGGAVGGGWWCRCGRRRRRRCRSWCRARDRCRGGSAHLPVRAQDVEVGTITGAGCPLLCRFLWQLEVSDQEWIVLATSHAVNACAETTP